MNNERYERQTMLPEIGAEGQKKLSEARVLIVGVGGLGSPAALCLAAAGVGHLSLMDSDTVSLSNLQRQTLYAENDIGRKKVFCAQKRLQSLNSSICIRAIDQRLTAENSTEIIENHDIIIDGCDNFATRYLIDDTCQRLGKTYIYGSVCGFSGQAAVFNLHGDGTSYRALFPDESALCATETSRGIVGTTAHITGSTLAAEAIKIICGCGTPLAGKLWTFDALKNEQTAFSI